MKMFTLVSASLAAVAAIAPIAANAQMQSTREHHEKRVVATTTVRTDNGRHNDHRNWRHHARQVCTMQWRHHHRVRVCHTNRW